MDVMQWARAARMESKDFCVKIQAHMRSWWTKPLGNHLQQDYFSGGTSHDLDYSELNENVASVDFKLMAPVEILHCGADCKGKQETRIDA